VTYAIHPTDPAERAELLGLWARNLPEAGEARYRWLYESGVASAWLARSDAGAVVGSTGLMTRRLRVFGRDAVAGQAIDLNVDREHRLLGAAIRLQRTVTATADEGRCELVYGLPNPQSAPVLRRCGYRVLGPMDRWARPLRLGAALCRRMRHPRLGRLASLAINPMLRWTGRETSVRLAPGFRVETLARFDRRFDDLWQRASAAIPIAGQRTADYLNWRYADCPSARYEATCLVDAGGVVSAYVVHHVHDGIAYVGDFLFDDAGRFDELLAEFVRRLKRTPVEAVVIPTAGAAPSAERFARLGFKRRPSPWSVLIYAGRHRPLDQWLPLLDPANWHLTLADFDTDF
jgi:hypothetical protein